MSKKLKDHVLTQISSGQVMMRPRYLFVLASALSAVGLLISSVVLVFSLYLLRFALTHPGPGAERKLALLFANLPWYVPVLAVTSLIGGIILLRRYDFSYRKNFGLVLAIALAGLYLGSLALERSRIEEFLTTRGYFRTLYRQNSPAPSPTMPFPRGRGMGRNR